MASELEIVRAEITALKDDIRTCTDQGERTAMRIQLAGLQNKENILLQGEIA